MTEAAEPTGERLKAVEVTLPHLHKCIHRVEGKVDALSDRSEASHARMAAKIDRIIWLGVVTLMGLVALGVEAVLLTG